MKRRDFFEKCGQGTFAVLLAYFGLKYPVFAGEKKEMSRKDMVKKMLIKEMGKTPEEADAMIADMEKKLPEVQKMCVCPKCPSFVAGDKPVGYCHPLVGESKLIEKEKGCICGTCPVFKKMEMMKGYYCTRGSEMEQNLASKK